VPHPSQSHREGWEPASLRASHTATERLTLPLPVLLFRRHNKFVISTEAADSFIVRCAVERPPHFVFVSAVAVVSAVVRSSKRCHKHSSCASNVCHSERSEESPHLRLSLPVLEPSDHKYQGAPSFAVLPRRVGVYNLRQPSALPVLLFRCHKHSSSRPKQRTVPSSVAQWRDPRISFSSLLLQLFVLSKSCPKHSSCASNVCHSDPERAGRVEGEESPHLLLCCLFLTIPSHKYQGAPSFAALPRRVGMYKLHQPAVARVVASG